MSRTLPQALPLRESPDRSPRRATVVIVDPVTGTAMIVEAGTVIVVAGTEGAVAGERRQRFHHSKPARTNHARRKVPLDPLKSFRVRR